MLTVEHMASAVLVAAFHVALLFALPILPLAVGSRAINAVQPARLTITPAIETAALLVGVVIGAQLLAAHIPSGGLDLAAIFVAGGYWDITLEHFLFERANPLHYPVFDVLAPADGGLFAHAPLLAAILVGIVPPLFARNAAGVANGARNVLIVLWAAYATVYAACLLLWLLALLNFWSFLVALVLVQQVRSR